MHQVRGRVEHTLLHKQLLSAFGLDLLKRLLRDQ